MMKKIILLFFLIQAQLSFAQSSFFENSDTVITKRILPVSIGIGSTWAGSMIALHQVWYKNVPKSKFHTFNDGANWLQMDKVGHIYTNYKISLLCGDLYKWSGMKPKKAALLGTGIGLGFQTTLEFSDAFSSEWGFSWYDMGSNIIGAGFYLGQELLWQEQRFLMKFSYYPTQYAALRPEVLGSNFQERILKDYNGQTYWLSLNPMSFYKNSTFPKWLCLSFGYSVDAKIVGDQELYIDVSNNQNTIYESQREYLFSLDVDFSKLNVKKPWLKAVLKQFNYIKVPFPALLLKNGKISTVPLYF